MHIGEWLAKLAEEEQEKTAATELETLFEHMSVEDVLKIAQSDGGMVQEKRAAVAVQAQPAPQPASQKAEQSGINKEAMAKLQFMDKVARQIARTRYEVEKTAAENVEPGTRYKSEGKKRKVKALDKLYRFQQGAAEHKGLRTGVGAAGGALMGAGLSAASKSPAVRLLSTLGGAGVGAGIGRLGAHFAKRRRQAISSMGERPKWHGQKERGMTKEDAFTTPEAQAKAKVMRRAMKATKGAPPKVMKSAIKMTAKQVKSV